MASEESDADRWLQRHRALSRWENGGGAGAYGQREAPGAALSHAVRSPPGQPAIAVGAPTRVELSRRRRVFRTR